MKTSLRCQGLSSVIRHVFVLRSTMQIIRLHTGLLFMELLSRVGDAQICVVSPLPMADVKLHRIFGCLGKMADTCM